MAVYMKKLQRPNIIFAILLILLIIIQVVAMVIISNVIYSGKYNDDTKTYDVKISESSRKFISVMSMMFVISSLTTMVYYLYMSYKHLNTVADKNSCRSVFFFGQMITIALTVEIVGSFLLNSMLGSSTQETNTNGENIHKFNVSKVDVAILRVSFPIIVGSFFLGSGMVAFRLLKSEFS